MAFLIFACAEELKSEQIAAIASLLVNMSLVSEIENESLFDWKFENTRGEALSSMFSHWTDQVFAALDLSTAAQQVFACHLSMSYVSHAMQFSSIVLSSTCNPSEAMRRRDSISIVDDMQSVIPVVALDLVSWMHERLAMFEHSVEHECYHLLKKFSESEAMKCIQTLYNINSENFYLFEAKTTNDDTLNFDQRQTLYKKLCKNHFTKRVV